MSKFKELWDIAWPKIKTGLETGDAIMDFLLLTGLYRHSKRRGKPVPNEKHFPRFAIESWHNNRNVKLLNQLSVHERRIIANWMLLLLEVQQNHWIVAIANKSWGETPAEEAVNTAEALNLYHEMAAFASDNERTAKADSIDFIKDPATEYFLVWLETQAGARFTNVKDAIKWIIDNMPAVLGWVKARAIATGKGIAAANTSLDNALQGSGLVNESNDMMTRAKKLMQDNWR